jgi:hypothetical protein
MAITPEVLAAAVILLATNLAPSIVAVKLPVTEKGGGVNKDESTASIENSFWQELVPKEIMNRINNPIVILICISNINKDE